MAPVSRRTFLKSAALLSAGLGLAGYKTIGPSHWSEKVVLEEVPIRVPDLPSALDEYRIGFLTDLHLANCADGRVIEESIELLNQARPDLVVLGGDYIWLNDSRLGQMALSAKSARYCPREGSSFESDQELGDALFESVSAKLRAIKSSNQIFGTFGNHDNWVSSRLCASRLSAAGIRMLTNEVATIRRGEATLSVIGVDDLWTGMPKLPALSKHKGQAEARLIVSHNPDFFSPLVTQRSFEFDLGLAGHTHGGQIRLPGIGGLYYNIEDRRFAEGLFDDGQSKVYTARGIGVVGLPFRLNCPPEATLLRLLRA